MIDFNVKLFEHEPRAHNTPIYATVNMFNTVHNANKVCKL